jgi:hypothetical protein
MGADLEFVQAEHAKHIIQKSTPLKSTFVESEAAEWRLVDNLYPWNRPFQIATVPASSEIHVLLLVEFWVGKGDFCLAKRPAGFSDIGQLIRIAYVGDSEPAVLSKKKSYEKIPRFVFN